MEGKYRLRDVIDSLDHTELLRIKNDLDMGGIHIKQFVQQKITENEKRHEAHCTTCSAPIDPTSTSTFTLIFGPADFRKKASFCAVDCMRYFLDSIDKIKKGMIEPECKNPNI